MKGGEGWFLVVLSITICMPDIYIDRVKGDGFFSFRFSNSIKITCLWVLPGNFPKIKRRKIRPFTIKYFIYYLKSLLTERNQQTGRADVQICNK